MEAYLYSFRLAIGRCLDLAKGLPAVLGLSGGRDSWHIALELHRLGVMPETFTLDYDHSTDASIARQRAEFLGTRHRTIQVWWTPEAEMQKNVATHFMALCHAQFVPACGITFRRPVLWDGLAGDVLSAGHQQTPERLALLDAGQIRELAASFVGRGTLSFLPKSCTYESAVSAVYDELRRWLGWPNPLQAFLFWNRTRNLIALAPFALMNPDGIVCVPYLDDTVFELLTAAGVREDIHTQTIEAAYPGLTKGYAEKRRATATYYRTLARGAIRAALLGGHIKLTAQLLRSAVTGSSEAQWQSRITLWLRSLNELTGRVTGQRQPEYLMLHR